MKKLLLSLSTCLLLGLAYGQDIIEWQPGYELKLSDFQSPATQVGNKTVYSLSAASGIDFAFNMSHYEFMFTKNFNSKVSCTFKRKASALVAPDTADAEKMVRFAQYEFDLAELYARRFRQDLYEQKGAFSGASFFQPLYNKLQEEMAERHTLAAKQSEMGRNEAVTEQLRSEVKKEIEALPDFCKDCKPRKKKK